MTNNGNGDDLMTAIAFISRCKEQDPSATKQDLAEKYCTAFAPNRRRSFFIGNGYAIRFSSVKGIVFSNTVLSLSALRNVDTMPFVVAVDGPNTVTFLLANSSFLSKVSHSSVRL